jgi:hypothetical protein
VKPLWNACSAASSTLHCPQQYPPALLTSALLVPVQLLSTQAAGGDSSAAGAAPAAGDGEGGAGALLSSFNVATFKNEEDDAAFWSRLIPVAERPPEKDESECLGMERQCVRTAGMHMPCAMAILCC